MNVTGTNEGGYREYVDEQDGKGHTYDLLRV